MKLRFSAFPAVLMVCCSLFLASDMLAPPASAQYSFPGYRVVSTDGREVEPKGCGPFLRWNLSSFPDLKIPYYINKKGSRDLSLPELKRAVEESFGAWKAARGAALDFRFAGFTDEKGLKRDGKNVIFFDETGEEFTSHDEREAFGKTQIVDFDKGTGEIREADIALNGTFIPPYWKSRTATACTGYAFKTPIKWTLSEQRCVKRIGTFPLEYRAHLQSTLTHEIGHFLGFGHTPRRGATMSTADVSDFAENTDQRTLEEDDRRGAAYLYPSDVFSASASQNIALGKPVRVSTNGAAEACLFCDKPFYITDGSLRYDASGSGTSGSVGWQNNDYNQLMRVTVTIDLDGRYLIEKIRYNSGNVLRAETWNADAMATPFGKTATNAGRSFTGAWTEQTGSLIASNITVTFEKTRKKWEQDWLFIGEIEVFGSPLETSVQESLKAGRPESGSWEGVIDPRRCWQPTGVFTSRSDTIQVTASGTVTWDPVTTTPGFGTVGPNGSRYIASQIIGRRPAFPLLSVSPGALLIKIGSSVRFAGESAIIRSFESGEVELMVNDEPDWLFDNSGRFVVSVRKQ